MKHFINILVTLILTGFAVGISYLIENSNLQNNCWGIAFVPLFFLVVAWGIKLAEDY
jgi:hypothetical protein